MKNSNTPKIKSSSKSKSKPTKSSLQETTVKEMANRLNPNSPYYEHEQNKRPHFAIFLGAGASVESGIHSANRMIEDFVKRICAVECPEIKTDKEKYKWLKDHKYYLEEREKYGSLFEKCFPTEVDRREYIESQVDGKTPSLGYIALAHLIKTKIVDTIITTNFDDLIYIGCTSYTDIRPVVYSLGNFASEIGGAGNRPRVLKLHGDFLFSDIKNTREEIGKQDPNMSQQVQQILESYRGLIVIGYSGNDTEILKLLSLVPKGKYLYWCVYKDEQVNVQVENLIKEKNGWIVRTEGFDKLLNEIRVLVDITDDQIFNLFEERRQYLEEEVKKFNPSKFIEFQSAAEANKAGLKQMSLGKYEEAEKAYLKAIELESTFAPAYHNLAIILIRDNSKLKEAETLVRKSIILSPTRYTPYQLLGSILHKQDLIEEAIFNYKKSLEFNPNAMGALTGLASIYKSMSQLELYEEYLNSAQQVVKDTDYRSLSFIYSIKEDKKKTLYYLELYSKQNYFDSVGLKNSKVFAWLIDDPEFKKLTEE
jgi:tetratricopeptide (TPR) repeat protein